MNITLFRANTTGQHQNCLYPHKTQITNEEQLRKLAEFDHVSAEYKHNYRSSDNFLQADNVVLDCDNDHSDDPDEWIEIKDIPLAFPGINLAIVTSRSHMKKKGFLSERPRFHVYFPTAEINEEQEYKTIKEKIASSFPFFDQNALDSARFIFGTNNPEVKIIEGDLLITEYLNDADFEQWDNSTDQIAEGKRNNTLSRFAGRIIKRYGDTPEARQKFLDKADLCVPPLETEELKNIWQSAVGFGRKIASQSGYIPPEEYNSNKSLKPSDFTDIGQATVLAEEYRSKLRYSPATDFIVYNGSFWEESAPKAQGIAQELTGKQLSEALMNMNQALEELEATGGDKLLEELGEKKAVGLFSKEQAQVFKHYQKAEAYRKYVLKRRSAASVTASLHLVKPLLEISEKDLDKNGFLLNTPSFTINLKNGEMLEHDNNHLITNQTVVDPGDDGMKLWQDALDLFFQNDKDLIDYVQKIAGLAAIGKVYVEALIIAYGDGRNGKSTFWNTIARVLGSYGGVISADILTVGCRRNAKPELAEARGKRILIASELEEGMRLNTSNIKQLCSTDSIQAEKKYKDPFSYVPSHTLILYTNHLPKVGAIDSGTWRRLIVIPFLAKIENDQDVKNYADLLFEKAGGAVLTWILEGARKVVQANFKISPPAKVLAAIYQYKENNDWLGHFLDECCELDSQLIEQSGKIYSEYRAFCLRTGEYARSTADFYTALEAIGIWRKKTKTGNFMVGLNLKQGFLN